MQVRVLNLGNLDLDGLLEREEKKSAAAKSAAARAKPAAKPRAKQGKWFNPRAGYGTDSD